MRTFILFICLLPAITSSAQPVTHKLKSAIETLEADAQMRNAIVGFYVVNNKTGSTIFNRNGSVGLAPASAQKVITSTTALEALGPNYRYKTELAYSGNIKDGVLHGDFYLIGYGDPTTGSERFAFTKEQALLDTWQKAMADAGIKKINGKVVVYDKNWESQTVPNGWPWGDVGNYYGAGPGGFNWRENQYDIAFKSGKQGDTVKVISTEPALFSNRFINEVVAGKPGSGDNAYIYRAPHETTAFLRGTIPPNRASFVISGSMHSPAYQLSNSFSRLLSNKGFGDNLAGNDLLGDVLPRKLPAALNVIHTHYSPTLDSINDWFLKKSINLYGEALLKSLDADNDGPNTAQDGIDFINKFWKEKGIEESAMKVLDGSGLSPQNRVTAEALVKVMQYARKQQWYKNFYNALPDINGLPMKSGTMGGVKSFTGYSGDYIFAIIVNNYNGPHADIQRKIWRVLDVLK